MYKVLLFICYFFVFAFGASAEGTREIWPSGSATADRTVLHIWQGTPKLRFATYLANADQRLYIHINEPGEIINMGFKTQVNGNLSGTQSMYYRLRRPDGTNAFTAKRVPRAAGAGFIASWAETIGPENVAGITAAQGYTPDQFTADEAGDWWIEFNMDNATTVDSMPALANTDVLEFWDISVCNSTQTTIYKGRLWSNELTFFSKQAGGGDITNGFNGTFYFYTTDSVINSLNFNGTFKPLLFYVHANNTGCSNTGNITTDRQSRTTKTSYPLYKEFLNMPDAAAYPPGSLPRITASPQFEGCGTVNGYNITIDVSHSGQNEIYLELNGVAGYQASTADRLLVQNIVPGRNVITWDGKNGLGAFVASGTSVPITCRYKGGIVHFPVWDAENSPGGVTFNLIGPTSGAVQTKVYYDDTQILAGNSDLNGVNGGVATHKYGTGAPAPANAADYGNNRTINTWVETTYEVQTFSGVATANCPVYAVAAARCLDNYSIGNSLASVTDGDGAITSAVLDSASLPPGTILNAGTGEITVSNPALMVAGTYKFRIKTTDALGGISGTTVTLLFYPALDPGSIAAPAVTVFCGSGDPGLITSTAPASGCNGTYSYQWQSSTDNFSSVITNIAGETGLTYNPPSVSSTIYYRRAATGAGYTEYSNIITITVNLNPTANAGPDLIINNTQSTAIGGAPTGSSGTTPYTYSWTPAAGLSSSTGANPTGSPSATTTYSVLVTDSKGCTATDVMVLTVNPTADLTVSKTVSAGPYRNGQNLTYTLTVGNTGPNNATGVVVNDLLPSGITFVSSVPSTGTYSSGTGVWSIGALANGATATLTITGTINTTGSITNTASVSGSQFDNDNTDNSSAVTINAVASSNLSIVKTVSSGPYNNGQNLTYTLTLSNSGPNSATNVVVNDLIPAGLTFVSSTPTVGGYASGPGIWTVGNLSAGASATLTIVATINTTGAVTNTASASATEFDSDNSNNSSSVTITASPSANIAISKTVSSGPYYNGQNLTYTLTVSNTGPNNATGLTVNDLLPAGLTYVSSATVSGTYNSGTGIWSIGALANGMSATLTITAAINTQGSISNTATATATEFDSNNANNTSTVSITAAPTANLSVTKTVSAGPYYNGQNLTYTITVNNTGPNNATGVTVNDLLPAGLTFAGSAPGTGTYNSATGVWSIGALANGGSATLGITATINSTGLITNTATVSAPEFDNNTANNTSSVSITSGATANLAVSKTVSPGPYRNGQNITYTVTVSNSGPNGATGVAVNDLLPAGLTYVSSAPGAGTYNPATGLWNVGSLSSGSFQTLSIVATLNTTGSVTNTATASAAEFDSNNSNNTSSVTITADPSADLSVSKTVSPGPYVNGAAVTYTIVVSNSGPDNATAVSATDILPASLTFVSSSASAGSYNSGTGMWSIGNLSSGGTQTLTINATINSSVSISNTATVTGGQYDANTTNNSSTSTINAGPTANLSVSKTSGAGPYRNGQNITYTVTVSNLGPNNATGVQVNDLLPAGLSFVSASPTAGGYAAGSGIWTIGNFASGASASLTIVATINTTGAITNTASVTATEFDSDNSNNTSAVTINAQPASNLSVSKTVSAGPYVNGQSITYTLSVNNLGPDNATGALVNDMLPAGITFVSSAASQGSYNSSTGIWTIGNIASGSGATLTITGTVNTTGSITNTASVSGNEFDSNSANNTSSVTITSSPSANLAVNKTVSAGPYNNGQNVTYTISVSNAGPNNASGVTVNDLLPSGLVYVSSVPGTGTYNSGTGVWNIGTLANGGTATLTITATLNTTGSITNTASVSANEFDNVTANNVSSVIITSSPSANVAVSKTVSAGPYRNGQNFTYTITVSSSGPNNATGVAVNDLLPAGLGFVSASASAGSYNSGTGIWTVGNLSNGGSQTLTIVVKPGTTGAIVNTATVSATEFDANTANNTSSVTVTVNPAANLSVTKSVSAGPYTNGQNITYTITAGNSGPDNATGVTINDMLPVSLSYVSSTASKGSYNSSTGLWNIGTLATGASETLTITATINSSASITNTATVSGAEFDSDNTNNSSSVTINANATANLSVTKVASAGPYRNGQNITYTITAGNQGPNNATGVAVNDLLPAGLTYLSSLPSTGTYNPGTGLWSVGNLSSGSTATLTITAAINTTGSITNTAAISSSEFDNDNADNTSSSTINAVPSANISVSKVAGAGPYRNGQSLSYTITVSNAGPNNATGVSVSDVLPSGLVYVSSTASVGSYSAGTGLWSVGTLTNGSSATLTLTVSPSVSGTISNTATASAAEFDSNNSNNSSTATVTVEKTVNLSVSKTVSGGPYNMGQNVSYTVTVSNLGPDAGTGINVNDLLPPGLTYVSSTPSTGSYNSGTGLWTVGNMSSGSSATLSIVATLATTGSVTNTATVSGAEFDGNTGNNTSSVTISGGTSADLRVTKTASAGPHYNATNVTFTVTASNLGPNSASGVSVTDLLPAGLSFVSYTSSTGTYNAGSGVWTVGNLANGGNATLTIVATVTVAGSLTNTATISGSDFDPVNTNNSASATITPGPSANLSVVKTVSPGPYRNGQNLTYTLTVSNNGPNTATGVSANDLLPANLVYLSSTPSMGSYNPSTGVWGIGTLNSGGTASLIITAKIDGSGNITNIAGVSGSEYDTDNANNTSSVTINATPTANLAVTKTVSAGPYNNGQNVTYTITASNAGPNNGTGVIVNDLLPSGLSYVSSSTATGTYTPGTGVWSIGGLNSGATATLTIVAAVTGTGSITNTANINGTNYDNEPANNSSSSTINVGTTADLSVIKTVSPGPHINGENVTYTITVTNNGPDDGSGVQVNDLLPSSLIYVSSTPSTGSYTSGTGIWNIGVLPAGSSATLGLTARLNASGSIANTATLSGNDFDPSVGNNTSTVTINALPSANLAISKTVSAGPYNNGQNITYTLTVSNNGPDNASSVIVNDLLPAGLSYVSSSATTGSYAAGSGVWSIGSLSGGGTATLSIVVTITGNGSISNTATVSGNESDRDNTNNTSVSTISVGTSSDLSISKTVSAGPYYNGKTITYTLVIANSGPNNATGVTVNDLLPSTLAYVSAAASAGSYNGVTGIWAAGNLASGASETLTITATIKSTGNITNSAVISGNDFDPSTGNNTSSVTVTAVANANLAVNKTVGPGPYFNGQQITYTVTVSNAGPNVATAVSATDLLPSALTYVSSTPSAGSYNPATGLWSIGTLNNSSGATLTITATINTTGSVTNSVSVTGNEFDSDNANNTSSVTINAAPTANLSVQKTVSSGPYSNGQNIVYTITARNSGPNSASGVSVNDLLPANLVFISSNVTSGSYNSGSGIWLIGPMSNGGTETLTITAQVNGTGTIVNTAVISGAEYDNNTANNTSVSTISVGTTADLQVTKTVSSGPYYNGQNITYTITLRNTGPNSATGITVQDVLPSSLVYVSSATGTGSYNPATGLWGVASLPNGSAVTLTIIARINGTGSITNTVTASGNDFDGNTANNSSSVTINASPAVNLSVTKTASAGPYTNGQNVIYTISVGNTGPDNATGVLVNDLLPASLVYVSSTPSSGSYNSATGIWNIGSLSNGSSASLIIVATINGSGSIINTASISGNEYDRNTANNTSSSTINVGTTADLSVSKTVSAGPHNNGQNITYTISAGNAGPNNASGVSVTDMLPSGLVYISSSATTGAYNAATGIWTIGSLASGQSQTLTVTARISNAGNIVNTATVSGNDFDGNTGNNSSVNTISANKSADLSVLKTVSPGPYSNGQNISYTISIGNSGPDNAGGVVVKDLLPSGLTYVSSSATTGSYNALTGEWSVGTLASGASATLTLSVNINGSGNIANTATIGGDDFDADPTDNVSTNTINVGTTVDLSVSKTVSPGPYSYDQTVTYTLMVNNNGPNNATGVKVNDLLPAGLAYLSSVPSKGSYTAGTGIWNIGSLANGGSALLTITAKITGTGSIINGASVSGADFDPNAGNNSSSVEIEVAPAADLEVIKTVSAGPYYTGQNVIYTVTAHNNGPNVATNVVVKDTLPAGLLFVASSAASYNPVTGEWTVGALAGGSSETLTVTARVISSGSIVNTAYVSGDEFDFVPGNNMAGVTISTSSSCDLAVTKTVSPGPYYTSGNIVYTISVSNSGPSDATGVRVLDILPSKVAFQGFTSSKGVYNPLTGVWNIGNLAGGGTETIDISVRLMGSGSITNTAVVSSDEYDGDSTNNVSSVSISVLKSVDLSITRTASGAPYYQGGVVTYALVAANAGPDNAGGVTVNNVLPPGLNTLEAIPTAGTYDPATNKWTLGSFTSGSSAGLVIKALINTSGILKNTTSITGSEYESDPADNSHTDSIVAGTSADISVQQEVSPGPYYNAQGVTYTLTIRNAGPSTARGIVVEDLLPPGLSYVSSSASTGIYNPSAGKWNLTQLIKGAAATLTIEAVFVKAGTVVNNIQANANEFDPQTSNNSSSLSLEVLPKADIAVTFSVNRNFFKVGENAVYTIEVKNNGPDSASSVQAGSLLSSGLTFVSAEETRGDYTPETGIWNIGTLLSGEKAVLVVNARVYGAGSTLSKVNVLSAVYDGDLSNNAASVTIATDNLPPVAVSECVTTFKNLQIKINILSNDSDPDGELDSNSVELITEGTLGRVISYNLLDRAITYIPQPGFTGVDKFYYTVKDKNGAVSNVDTVCINVMETFEIPSGFTPNNDGKNDMWQIKGLESYPDNEVVIFNRWGNEVFKTAGYSAENAWTGSELNAGTYYYIIRIRVNETEKTFTGYVTLIR